MTSLVITILPFTIKLGSQSIVNSIRQQRRLKMMAIADRHFSYDNESDLVKFIDADANRKIRPKQ